MALITAQSNYEHNSLHGATGHGQVPTPVPRTIATALSGMNKLNERLDSVRGTLSNLCETIGGPYPAIAQEIGKDRPPISGAVGRLNESSDSAHATMSEIEGLLSCIARSLG